MEATVLKANSITGPPFRSHEVGDIVDGPEADRLVFLSLAEYNVVESPEPAPADSDPPSDTSSDTEEKES